MWHIIWISTTVCLQIWKNIFHVSVALNLIESWKLYLTRWGLFQNEWHYIARHLDLGSLRFLIIFELEYIKISSGNFHGLIRYDKMNSHLGPTGFKNIVSNSLKKTCHENNSHLHVRLNFCRKGLLMLVSHLRVVKIFVL